jgi:hypothetical protein
MQVFVTSNGRYEKKVMTLGPKLAQGGEGIIYPVVEYSEILVKKYTPGQKPEDMTEQEWKDEWKRKMIEKYKKLETMLEQPPDEKKKGKNPIPFSWPLDLVADENGKFIGFLMPFAEDRRPIFELYNPVKRRNFSGVDYKVLLLLAHNVSVVFNMLHSAKYVIADVNQNNLLVSNSALVTLVDTDSFQVINNSNGSIYLCDVGVEDFTPPELQIGFRTTPLGKIRRNPHHDCFGLGVLIFLLLMEGVHPFDGIYNGSGEVPPRSERITKGYFPHGNGAGPFKPRPNTLTFDTLAPSLQTLFLRCFKDGHKEPSNRPNAEEWRVAIFDALKRLHRCQKEGHFYFEHLKECPFCTLDIPVILVPISKPLTPIDTLKIMIIGELKQKSPQNTSQLAGALDEKTDRVYRVCISLSDNGQISTYLKKDRRIAFFPVTGEVVTKLNLNRCNRIAKELKKIIEDNLGKPLAILEQEIRNYFIKLYCRPDLSPYRTEIKKFENRLLNFLKRTQVKADIFELFAIRYGFVNQRYWAWP